MAEAPSSSPTTPKGRLLVVDDDADTLRLIRAVLMSGGWQVSPAQSSAQARQALENEPPFDAAIVDVYLGEENGLDYVRELRGQAPQLGIVVISGDDSSTLATQAIETGADNFVSKPVSPAALMLTMAKVVELSRERYRAQQLAAELHAVAGLSSAHGIVSHSDSMAAAMRLVERAAPSDVSVLVFGESGTGKELVARAIHQGSPRSRGPFIELNCAALPPNLVESELFGHERGAFTGAIATRPGRMEQANGGTLFLDEIGELPLDIQPKLLRALQDRRITRVGGTQPIACDFRLVSATNRDLAAEVQQGRFREDLFFRVAVLPIQLPPLRRRPEDLDLLLSHFLQRYGGRDIRVTPAAHDMLRHYAWPGNVRELQNFAQAAVVLADHGIIDEDQVRGYLGSRLPHVAAASSSIPAQAPQQANPRAVRRLADVEREEIVYALQVHQGDVAEAARALDMGRATLYKYLARHGMRPPDFQPTTSEHGFTLIELLLVIIIVAIFALSVQPQHPPMYRGRAAAARYQMKGIARALDAYRVQYGTYPPPMAAEDVTSGPKERERVVAAGFGNHLSVPAPLLRRTVQDTSITLHIEDPFGYFAQAEGLPLGYATNGKDYVLTSVGPDGRADVDLSAYLSPDIHPTTESLAPYRYEDTKNKNTPGDVIVFRSAP